MRYNKEKKEWIPQPRTRLFKYSEEAKWDIMNIMLSYNLNPHDAMDKYDEMHKSDEDSKAVMKVV
jgi:hypothetical protein